MTHQDGRAGSVTPHPSKPLPRAEGHGRDAVVPIPPTSSIDAEGLSGDSFEVTRPAVILSLERELIPVGIPEPNGPVWPRSTGVGKALAKLAAVHPRYYRAWERKEPDGKKVP